MHVYLFDNCFRIIILLKLRYSHFGKNKIIIIKKKKKNTTKTYIFQTSKAPSKITESKAPLPVSLQSILCMATVIIY